MDKEKAKNKFNTTEFHKDILVDVKPFIDNGTFFGNESTIEEGITPTKELKEQMKMVSSEISSIPEIKKSDYVLNYVKGDNIGGSHQECPEIKKEMKQIMEDIEKRLLLEKTDLAVAIVKEEKNPDLIKDTSIHISDSYYDDKAGWHYDETIYNAVVSLNESINEVADKQSPALKDSVSVILMPNKTNDKDDMTVEIAYSKSAFKTHGIDVNDFLKDVKDVATAKDDAASRPSVLSLPENDNDAKEIPVYKRIVGSEFVGMTDNEWQDVPTVKKDKLYDAFGEESPVKKLNKSMMSMKL